MPQASEDLRDIARLLFGSMMDKDAVNFLESRGFKLNLDWTWELPPDRIYLYEKEELAIRFLIEEWDYGNIRQGYYYPG